MTYAVPETINIISERYNKGDFVVCRYNTLRFKYNLTIDKIYHIEDIKIYGAFSTYVIRDDNGDTQECSSILFLSLQRAREIKLEELGI